MINFIKEFLHRQVINEEILDVKFWKDFIAECLARKFIDSKILDVTFWKDFIEECLARQFINSEILDAELMYGLHVPAHVVLDTRPVGARGALEGLLPSVAAKVSQQIMVRGKALAAHRASVVARRHFVVQWVEARRHFVVQWVVARRHFVSAEAREAIKHFLTKLVGLFANIDLWGQAVQFH